MANRTVKDARTVKGTNPQYLIEKIVRTRIYDSQYWKEDCFALTGELLVDKAMELRYIGGTYAGNIKPSPFICLLLKMLQIQPDTDIVVEFIKNEDFKYVRCLGAFYLRLVGESQQVYKYLEPLYNDFRKIRMQNKDGSFYLSHVDEFIDIILRDDRVCDTILPRLQKREILEELGELEPRVFVLEEDLDQSEEEESEEEGALRRTPSPKLKKRDRKSRDERRRRSKSRERRSRSRSRSRERSSRSHRKRDRRDRDRTSPNRERGSDKKKGDDLSVEETNKLRISLGLAPLK